MGHINLGALPRTRRWKEVVALIECGAGVAQVATATILAAEKALKIAANDKGVVETVWLLMQLPHAARTNDFLKALNERGIVVRDVTSLPDVVSAVSERIDAAMPNCRGRSDLGEMAQMAAVETITRVIGQETRGLFETTHNDVQRALADHATVKRFGTLARDFFARFLNKCMSFFLSRTLAQHVGEGRRFTTLAQQADFNKALATHTREAARIVEEYSGGWLSKENWQSDGHVTREATARFTSYAMTKLVSELKEGA